MAYAQRSVHDGASWCAWYMYVLLLGDMGVNARSLVVRVTSGRQEWHWVCVGGELTVGCR